MAALQSACSSVLAGLCVSLLAAGCGGGEAPDNTAGSAAAGSPGATGSGSATGSSGTGATGAGGSGTAGGSTASTGAGGGGGGQPPVSDILVPAEGAWWGAYAAASAQINWDWGVAIQNFEAHAGRKLDIVYRYHDWGTASNGVFPDMYEQAQMAQSYILHVAWESRTYQGGINITWAEIAGGSQDAVIDEAAQRARNAPAKFMINFDHEMDNTAVHASDGADSEYVAAYRHIIDRFKQAGVTNVVWVWTPMGWSGTYSRLKDLYPGDNYIDWLGYDPYNFYTCNGAPWKDAATTFGSYYQWMHEPDQMTWHGPKPYVLAEYSSHEDPADPGRKGQWTHDIVAGLKLYPDIKAVQFFNSNVTLTGGFCNLVVDSSPAAVEGFVAAGSDPYVNQPKN